MLAQVVAVDVPPIPCVRVGRGQLQQGGMTTGGGDLSLSKAVVDRRDQTPVVDVESDEPVVEDPTVHDLDRYGAGHPQRAVDGGYGSDSHGWCLDTER